MSEELPELQMPGVEELMKLVSRFGNVNYVWGCDDQAGRDTARKERRADELHTAIRAYAERLAVDARRYEGPKGWTPEEVAMGNMGIRWVTETYVAGRPTAHDVREYLQARNGDADCSCADCQSFYANHQGGQQ